jgi:hypothetical protein
MGRLLQQEHFDLIFFSTTQFAILPLGRLWKKKFGIPYVIDLQDPWLTDYYELPGSRKPPGGWKYRFSKLQAKLLEGWTFKKAAGFISVSQGYFTDLEKRYPWFQNKPKVKLNFGVSAADFAFARQRKKQTVNSDSKNKINFLYTGAAGPIMPVALNAFCQALVEYWKVKPQHAERFHFEFIGTSYAPPNQARASVLPIAAEHGLAALFSEAPARQGYLECLRRQEAADILLLLGSTDLSYSPSKLYQYFLAKRPILAITFDQSVMKKTLLTLNCATVITVPTVSSENWDMKPLWEFFDQALLGFSSPYLPLPNESYFQDHYSAENLTRRQCDFFASVLSTH